MRNGLLTNWVLLSSMCVVGYLTVVSEVKADFIKMPQIEELRKIKEKTLLRDINIPAVRDRLTDPEAGPRLAVAEFRIQGLVEFPEMGITREAVAELVEGIRFDLMGEGQLLKSGYTIDELGELSNLLVDIEEETVDRHVTNIEVQKLVWMIRAQQGKRGVTVGQIEGVASSITQFYRERGFILAKAYIPKQEVRDGIVNLTVLLGVLGEVHIQNNDMYDTDILTGVFDEFIDKPVTNESIEESLFIINHFPGITVDGYFEPGSQVGDTRLNVNVRDESIYNFSTRIDNHGAVDTGLYRLFLDGQINNLFGVADYLHVSLLQSVLPADTTYGQFSYESNFISPRVRVGVEVSENQFVADQSSGESNQDLSGTVNVYGMHVNYIEQRSRKRNSSYQFRIERINSDLQLGDLPPEGRYLDQILENISLSYNFDFLNDKDRVLHEASFTLNRGHFDFGFSPGQHKTNYNVYSIDYTRLSFVNIPYIDKQSRFIFRNHTQYSGTTLSTLGRYSLSGPTKVRGFTQSYFTGDDALYLGFDWVFNSPSLLDFTIVGSDFSNTFKPFAFADYAYGKRYSINPGEKDAIAHLADIGVGIQIAHQSGVNGTAQLAFPVMNKLKITGEEPEYDTALLTFNLQYSF